MAQYAAAAQPCSGVGASAPAALRGLSFLWAWPCKLAWILLPFFAFVGSPKYRDAVIVGHEVLSGVIVAGLFWRAHVRGRMAGLTTRRYALLSLGFACVATGDFVTGLQFSRAIGIRQALGTVGQLLYSVFWFCVFVPIAVWLWRGTRPGRRLGVILAALTVWLFLVAGQFILVAQTPIVPGNYGSCCAHYTWMILKGLATAIALVGSLVALAAHEFFFVQSLLMLGTASIATTIQAYYFRWESISPFECAWSAALGGLAVAVSQAALFGNWRLFANLALSSFYSVRVALGSAVFLAQLALIGAMWVLHIVRFDDHSHAAAAMFVVAASWVMANWISLSFVLNVQNAMQRVPHSTDIDAEYAELFVVPVRPQHQLLDEFEHILLQHIDLAEHTNMLARELCKRHQEAARSELAANVAHDIRSPLAALNIVMRELSQLPEDLRSLTRTAIQRIGDIANILLLGTQATPLQMAQAAGQKTALLLTTLDALISEKRAQYRQRLNLRIELMNRLSSYDAFVADDGVGLARTVSNLINNAAEAIEGAGVIVVTCECAATEIILTVEDNGPGIDRHRLSQLGSRGLSFKESGHGLGLAGAKDFAQTRGGTFVMESEVGQGTKARLTLPRASPPPWFLTKLCIVPSTQIVVIDDDASVHGVWDSRFGNLLLDNPLRHFSNVAPLDEELSTLCRSQLLILMDYELIGSKQDGLRVLEQRKLVDCAVLVTSHFSHPDVVSRCLSLGIKVIPKGLASSIPVEMTA